MKSPKKTSQPGVEIEASVDAILAFEQSIFSLRFPDIATMPDEPAWSLIRAVAARPSLEAKVCASIMAAVCIDKRPVFVLGRQSIERLIKESSHISRQTINGGEINVLMARLLSGDGFLRKIFEPSKRVKGEKAMAGVYTINQNPFTDLFEWWPSESEIMTIAGNIPSSVSSSKNVSKKSSVNSSRKTSTKDRSGRKPKDMDSIKLSTNSRFSENTTALPSGAYLQVDQSEFVDFRLKDLNNDSAAHRKWELEFEMAHSKGEPSVQLQQRTPEEEAAYEKYLDECARPFQEEFGNSDE